MNEYATTVLQPFCPDCGMHVATLLRPVDLDWRDDRERILGENACAVQEHRVSAHPVTPQLGDVVAYFAPWRGMIIGSGPLVVRGITEYDMNAYARDLGGSMLDVQIGTKYWLADASRPNNQGSWTWPTTGDIRYPVTFEIIAGYVPAPAEHTLFDLLGDEWAAESEAMAR